jgi:glycosyltransferase involved in cell wall biosynthesis
MKIVFLLPVAGGGGGAHSVIQEASEMIAMGTDVQIAVNASNLTSMQITYSDMPSVVGKFLPFQDISDLIELIPEKSIVVATIFTSVKLLNSILKIRGGIIPAYYIQDYEPLFSEINSALWKEARDSYTLIPNAILFAKTEWLQNIVFKNHGVRVHKVEPSIDHSVYYPSLSLDRSRICAMIRPKSPRRAPYRTMRVLRGIKKALPSIQVEIFGCSDEDILNSGVARDFEFTNHGVLKRHQVSTLMRKSGLFLDLSDFQAFGRTGLEAMACGCVPVITNIGGVYEYADHGIDSYVMDMSDEDSIIETCVNYFRIESHERRRLMNNAIDKSQAYSIRKAALSELRLFLEFC